MSELDSSFQNDAKVNALDIADNVRRCFCSLIGQEVDDNEGKLERWLNAVEFLFKVCAAQEEARWGVLAQRVAGIVCPHINWDVQSPLLLAVWEAATRHSVNLITVEDREEFDSVKDYDWHEWVLQKGKVDERVQNASG